ncbi:hypothetical protein HYC85_023038 [Camellia sinensis]|uniref:3-methyl-2-oxobutanoate hydroxymethyltransferase n=1 Tax=Camellia sinensis TaxID=4442 RepID=A0A7J7GDD3_CAMSI|nr:hypothetical protein HYC85_023038 [Camellia sinensis]
MTVKRLVLEALELPRAINPEVGPLVSLPAVGSRVVYFSQGHSEQANVEIDEVYAQMTLQPLSPVVEFALALQEARCFSVVLKCALALVAAATITSALRIPTTGIGAGTFCSGQVN